MVPVPCAGRCERTLHDSPADPRGKAEVFARELYAFRSDLDMDRTRFVTPELCSAATTSSFGISSFVVRGTSVGPLLARQFAVLLRTEVVNRIRDREWQSGMCNGRSRQVRAVRDMAKI